MKMFPRWPDWLADQANGETFPVAQSDQANGEIFWGLRKCFPVGLIWEMFPRKPDQANGETFPVAAMAHDGSCCAWATAATGKHFRTPLRLLLQKCFPVAAVVHVRVMAPLTTAATVKHFWRCYHRSDGETFPVNPTFISGRMFPRRPDSSNGETFCRRCSRSHTGYGAFEP